jgi:Na+-translocating ferredoxin:NAD+ oxidoreductase RnfE subunit
MKQPDNSAMKPGANLATVIVWGIAPIVAVAVRFDVALWFSLIAIAVALLVTLFVHVITDLVPETWQLAWTMVFAAFLVTLAEIVCDLVAPDLLDSFGVYLPILALSPLVLMPLEQTGIELSIGERLGRLAGVMVRFFLLMLGLGLFRELLASGSLTLVGAAAGRIQLVIPGLADAPVGFLATTAGGLILTGLLLALRNWRQDRKNARQAAAEAPGVEAGS